MEITVRAKNFKLTETHEEQIRKRIERLVRHLPNTSSAEVLLAKSNTHLNPQGFEYVAQVTIHTRHGNLMRSEVHNAELLNAIDQSCEHLSRQIHRFRARYDRRKKGSTSLGRTPVMDTEAAHLAEFPSIVEMAAPAEAKGHKHSRGNGQEYDSEEDEEGHGSIVRVKGFSAKPMFPEDAVEQMELLGHTFFVFMNASDESVNVLYRRRDGNYGLLRPEFG
jgi:putative sigma-54 modulation protein